MLWQPWRAVSETHFCSISVCMESAGREPAQAEKSFNVAALWAQNTESERECLPYTPNQLFLLERLALYLRTQFSWYISVSAALLMPRNQTWTSVNWLPLPFNWKQQQIPGYFQGFTKAWWEMYPATWSRKEEWGGGGCQQFTTKKLKSIETLTQRSKLKSCAWMCVSSFILQCYLHPQSLSSLNPEGLLWLGKQWRQTRAFSY